MKKRILSLVLSVFLVFSAISIAAVSVSAENSIKETFFDRIRSDFDLVWNDEFNTGTLDETKWRFGGDGIRINSEQQVYANGMEDGNVEFDDENLIIIGKKETKLSSRDGKAYNYTSAWLSTLGLQNWKYGYFEIRARLPIGGGLCPAIWTQGYQYKDGAGDWPYSGEIDIMESESPNSSKSTLHHSPYKPSSHTDHVATGAGVYNTSDGSTVYDKYHNYWLYWTDKALICGVDDGLCQIIDLENNPQLAQSFTTYEHWLILNLAFGMFGGKIDDSYEDYWRMYVDYVRVYQPSDGNYDDYSIFEAEDTVTDSPTNTSYSLTHQKTISNLNAAEDVSSVVENIEPGTYDVYAAYIGQPQSRAGSYNVLINGNKTANTLFTGNGTDYTSSEQAFLGTVKIDESKPFEIKFDYDSGTKNRLYIDKYMFVKTDRTPDAVVNSSNCHSFIDEVTVSSQEQLLQALSVIRPSGTIKLDSDITLSSTVTVYRDFVLDLNNHTLNSGTLKSPFNIRNVVDISINNGKIIVNGDSSGFINQFITANECYGCSCNISKVDFTVNATSASRALFAESYGSCDYKVSDCSFNYTSSSLSSTNPPYISYGTSAAFSNVSVSGNGLVAPFKAKNSASNGSVNKLLIYNCDIKDCQNLFVSDSALTKNVKIDIAATSVSNNTALTNHSENMSFVSVADSNTVYNKDNAEITLAQSTTDFYMTCNHSFSKAACTSPAECAYCHITSGEPLGAHIAGEPVTTPSDCFVHGSITTSCTVCGEVFSKEILPLTEHDYVLTTEFAPNCAAMSTWYYNCHGTGYKAYTCNICGFVKMTSYTGSPATDTVEHTPDLSLRVVTPAACSSPGTVQDVCTVCGKTYISKRMLGGHKYSATVVPPTCVDDGYTLHECSVCSDSYKDKILEASGEHNYVDGYCTVCGAPENVFTLTIDGESKAYERDAVVTLAAQESEGFVAYTDGTDYYYAGQQLTMTKDYELSSVSLAFSMLYGASIRYNSSGGIRFYSAVDTELIEKLRNAGATIGLGTIISKKSIIGNEEFTKQISGQYVDVEYTSPNWYTDNRGFKGVTGSIIEIQEENLNESFIGRGYITVKFGDVEKTIYADYANNSIVNNSRSICWIANRIMLDDHANLTDEQFKIVKDFADKYQGNDKYDVYDPGKADIF